MTSKRSDLTQSNLLQFLFQKQNLVTKIFLNKSWSLLYSFSLLAYCSYSPSQRTYHMSNSLNFTCKSLQNCASDESSETSVPGYFSAIAMLYTDPAQVTVLQLTAFTEQGQWQLWDILVNRHGVKRIDVFWWHVMVRFSISGWCWGLSYCLLPRETKVFLLPSSLNSAISQEVNKRDFILATWNLSETLSQWLLVRESSSKNLIQKKELIITIFEYWVKQKRTFALSQSWNNNTFLCVHSICPQRWNICDYKK